MKLDFILNSNECENNQYFTKAINDNLYLHFKSPEYIHEVEKGRDKLFCYGYFFDIRKPELSMQDTMNNLINSSSFINDLAYLNGQYILIFKSSGEVLFTTDAMSLLPTYVDEDYTYISNSNKEIKQMKFFNSRLVLDLVSKSTKRIIVDNNIENINEFVISTLKNMYKFFDDKNLVLPFTSNQFMKSLLAMLKNTLSGQHLILTDIHSEIDQKFAHSIAKDFDMNLVDSYKAINKNNVITIRNQLINFQVRNETKEYSSYDEIIKDELFENLPIIQKNREYELMVRKRKQAESIADYGLLFDPLNVHIIYQNIINSSQNPKEFSEYIQSELLPMLNYYDFYKNDNLNNVNLELEEKIQELENQRITAHNQKFLLDTELSPFKVSNNLDGKLKNKSLIVYPAYQKIKKNEEFKVIYHNLIDGFITLKSTYKNVKNGRTIEVRVNNVKYTIDQLYNGILINPKGMLKIVITYKAERNSLPWQKAGTIIIQKN